MRIESHSSGLKFEQYATQFCRWTPSPFKLAILLNQYVMYEDTFAKIQLNQNFLEDTSSEDCDKGKLETDDNFKIN